MCCEITTETTVARGPAMQGLFTLSGECCCHSKSPGAGGVPAETHSIWQHTCSEQGNVRFQERERQTFCLANWHIRVWDMCTPGRKVSGVWGSESSEEGLGSSCFYWGCSCYFLHWKKIIEIVLTGKKFVRRFTRKYGHSISNSNNYYERQALKVMKLFRSG